MPTRRGRPRKDLNRQLDQLGDVAVSTQTTQATQTIGRRPILRMYSQLDEPMTPKQLAHFLKVSPVTIKRRLNSNELPSFRVGKQVRFIPREVIEHIRKKKEP